MTKKTMIRGTILLTSATFISKFLGMMYTIPFENLVGATGGRLYGLAYSPYTIFISLSTVGIPAAVSKFVAKYNSLGDYRTGQRMYKLALRLMMLTGLIAFLILFFGAGVLARIYIPANAEGITVADVTFVIRMISFALLVIPSMSITRGFFQGHQSMGPTALSQVVEQVVRITFLLTSVYLVIHVFGGSITTAVGFATFAAFVGAISSALVLFWYWRKRKKHLDNYRDNQTVSSVKLSTQDLFKEILSYAGPFIFVGLAIPLYQQIDAITFTRTLTNLGYDQAIIDHSFSNINLYGHKLIMIPITLATGVQTCALPILTKSFVDGKRKLLFQQINQSLHIIMLLILPAVIETSILSNEIWGAFYSINEYIDLNGYLLSWYAPVALFFGLFIVKSFILHRITHQNFDCSSVLFGLVLKSFLNVPLMRWFGPEGAVIVTGVASITTVLANLWCIKTAIQFPLKELAKRSLLMAIFTSIMAVVVLVIKYILSFFSTYQDGRMDNILILLITVTFGAGVYLWFSYKSTLLERVVGGRIRFLDRLFKR